MSTLPCCTFSIMYFFSIGDKIGSGQFGTVNKATWKQSAFQLIKVAAKTLKDDASEMDKIRFLQEAAMMAQFRHPNVVALYGVAQKAGKVCSTCVLSIVEY